MNRTTLKDLGDLVTTGKLKTGSIRTHEPLIAERDANDIAVATIGKAQSMRLPPAHGDTADVHRLSKVDLNSLIIQSIDEAYDLGKKHGAAEQQLRNDTVAEVNDQRAQHLVPAAVAAIMESTGMSSMTLDLAAVSTVFKRCKIEYALSVDGKRVEYTLTHRVDEVF